MLTLHDQKSAIQAVTTLFESVRERPVAVAVIGENGCERVWLAEELEHAAGKEWAAKHFRAASEIALYQPLPSAYHGQSFVTPKE